MRRIITLFTILTITLTYAQDKNARGSMEVDGVCGMCKERIEKAAIQTKGVKSAVWSKDTHELRLIYDARKTDLDVISRNIADVGHDTKLYKATDEAYQAVDDCCRYRDPKVLEDHGMEKKN